MKSGERETISLVVLRGNYKRTPASLIWKMANTPATNVRMHEMTVHTKDQDRPPRYVPYTMKPTIMKMQAMKQTMTRARIVEFLLTEWMQR